MNPLRVNAGPFKKKQPDIQRAMKHRIILVLLIICLLPAGCIRDDLSECNNVTIYFQYKADGDKDVLYQYMDQVDLYVFDESNRIMGVGHYNSEQLSSFSAIPSFRLSPGRYKVVALGNSKDYTEVVNLSATDFNEIYIQHPNWGKEGRVDNHDDNYLGQKIIEVKESNVKTKDTVELFSSHIDVSVEIYGLDVPGYVKSEDMPFELSFENSNAQTTFNNEINTEQKGTCYPKLIYDAEKKCFRTDDLALFRMDCNGEVTSDFCSHTLVLKDLRSGEELLRGSIYNYVTKNSDRLDITKQEALLPISIKFSSVGVTIDIPDWAIEDVKPEF